MKDKDKVYEKSVLTAENNYLKNKLKKINKQNIILEKINLNIQFQYIFSTILNYGILPPVKILANALLSFIEPIAGIRIDDEEKKEIEERVTYTLDILHYLYMLANPHYLYDQPIKNEMQIQQISLDKRILDVLDLVLNEYSGSNPQTDKGIKDYLANELNKPLPSIPIMEWISNLPHTVQRNYRSYFLDLFEQVKDHYLNLGYILDESFLVRRIVHTSHPRQILNEIFDIIATHPVKGSGGLIDSSNDTRARFLSMFSTTSNTNEGLIEWKDKNPKNGAISLQSFKVLFKTMYEYDDKFSYSSEKASITSFFGYRQEGKIKKLSPAQVRDREGKISESNKHLEQRLRELLNKYFPNKS